MRANRSLNAILAAEVRLGSPPDYRHPHPERPHLEVKQT